MTAQQKDDLFIGRLSLETHLLRPLNKRRQQTVFPRHCESIISDSTEKPDGLIPPNPSGWILEKEKGQGAG
jgi:hypothetical protein